jgi:hypothetical protein
MTAAEPVPTEAATVPTRTTTTITIGTRHTHAHNTTHNTQPTQHTTHNTQHNTTQHNTTHTYTHTHIHTHSPVPTETATGAARTTTTTTNGTRIVKENKTSNPNPCFCYVKMLNNPPSLDWRKQKCCQQYPRNKKETTTKHTSYLRKQKTTDNKTHVCVSVVVVVVVGVLSSVSLPAKKYVCGLRYETVKLCGA